MSRVARRVDTLTGVQHAHTKEGWEGIGWVRGPGLVVVLSNEGVAH